MYSVNYREEILYKLLKERDETSSISHKRLPGMREHVEFVASKPYRDWCFITAEEGIVGTVYCTHNNEIGLQILREHRRKGYGLCTIHLLSYWRPEDAIPSIRAGEFLFSVKPGNKAGIGLLQKAGLKLRQITYEYSKDA